MSLLDELRQIEKTVPLKKSKKLFLRVFPMTSSGS